MTNLSPVQDVEIGAILLLHEVAEESLCGCVEVPEGVDVGVPRVLQHLDALREGKAQRLEHGHVKGILLANHRKLLACGGGNGQRRKVKAGWSGT